MSDSYAELSIQLARHIIPVIIFLGILGNAINITVLTRPNLYNHACSRYFLALSVNGLVYSSVNLVYRLAADGYRIDVATHSMLACKLVTYMTQLCIPMPPYFIVLASIDRYFTSSSSVRIRRLSSVRVSRYAILLVVMIFTLLYINTPIIVTLNPADGFGCRNDGKNWYKQAYGIIQCVLFAIVAPILMVLFGFLTILNTQKVAGHWLQTSRRRRTDRQLMVMLLIQVSTHIWLTLPVCVIYAMLVLPTGFRATRFIMFLYSVVSLPWHLSYASAFPLYFLSARLYRRELFNTFAKWFHCLRFRRIMPMSVQPSLMMRTQTTSNQF